MVRLKVKLKTLNKEEIRVRRQEERIHKKTHRLWEELIGLREESARRGMGLLRGYIRAITIIKKDKSRKRILSFGYRDGNTVRHIYTSTDCAEFHVQPSIRFYQRAKNILKEIARLDTACFKIHRDDPEGCQQGCAHIRKSRSGKR